MKNHKTSNQLRIIGGQWRSRRLNFANLPGLRPTADRIRETLFNWLAPHIQGASVIDVFSGSGALLLEAMSRGAQSGLGLELAPAAQQQIQQNLQLLSCANASVICSDSLQYLNQPSTSSFDIAFVDPPFHRQLLEPACQLLEQNGWLAADALIYLESELAPHQYKLPNNWQLLREKSTSQFNYSLWQRQQAN